MNFTLQPCWYSGRCIHHGKRSCTDDVAVSTVLAAARELLEQNSFCSDTDWPLSGSGAKGYNTDDQR